MITVACVKWGEKYSQDYVQRLTKMVRKYYSGPMRFVCISDTNMYNNDFKIIIPNNEFDLEGWWAKMFLWKRGILSGKVLYLDLDIVIQNNIDELIDYAPDKLCGVYTYWDDRYTDGTLKSAMYRYKTPFNSSCMVWNAEDYHWVWDKFAEDPNWYIMKYYGDDKFLGNEVHNKTTFKKDWFYSRLYGIDMTTPCNDLIKIEGGSQEVHLYPNRKICLFNGPTTDYHYKGYERYWYD